MPSADDSSLPGVGPAGECAWSGRSDARAHGGKDAGAPAPRERMRHRASTRLLSNPLLAALVFLTGRLDPGAKDVERWALILQSVQQRSSGDGGRTEQFMCGAPQACRLRHVGKLVERIHQLVVRQTNAMQILDEHQAECLLVGCFTDDGGDGRDTRPSSCAPAALASDQLPAAAHPPNHHRLDLTIVLERISKLQQTL